MLDSFRHTDQLVFFVDLLGESDVVINGERDGDQLLRLTQMLSGFAESRGEFSIEQATDRIAFATPTISTFSDHLLLSFKIDEMSKRMSDPFREALWLARIVIGALAAEALESGMLIRGGATYNSLYHQDGVAIGAALIEAYDLERSIAKYPRIVVSRKLYSKGPFDEIVTDDDGIRYFDYIPEMLGRKGRHRNAWIGYFKQFANQRIEEFEAKEKWNEMSKWVWFLNKLTALE